ncbi:MAG TPA: preprotein translocase subunit TatB [Syntrophaceae bacterium]|jgi:tRNA 2-thiouridine synthesizing protein A|nr:preprotein translocase subunit TatB [Syntrophaceae bacterium]
MSSVIDARGLSCPQPVILTLNRLKEMDKGKIDVLVDTDTSKENVSRAAMSKGWQVKDVQPDGQGYRVILEKT